MTDHSPVSTRFAVAWCDECGAPNPPHHHRHASLRDVLSLCDECEEQYQCERIALRVLGAAS